MTTKMSPRARTTIPKRKPTGKKTSRAKNQVAQPKKASAAKNQIAKPTRSAARSQTAKPRQSAANNQVAKPKKSAAKNHFAEGERKSAAAQQVGKPMRPQASNQLAEPRKLAAENQIPHPTNKSALRTADPFTVFLDELKKHAPPTQPGGKRFASGEHVWLGGMGALVACNELRARGVLVDLTLFQSIERLKTKDRLTYGELVALSGDFYGSPEALYEEKPSPLPWLYEADDLDDLRDTFRNELQWIEARQRGQGSDAYPDNNIRMAWNAKSYVELALQNTDHFGWHNLKAYCRHHAIALELAKKAKGRETQDFTRALFVNAFADHFLTDGFAAGHIRVPRAEIREWGARNGYDDKLAGALSKLLHDQDGHVNSVHGQTEDQRPENDGLRVRNSNGDEWFTRCDGQLFLPQGAADGPAVKNAVNAVAASVKELLLAWKTGELPQSEYAATRLVPFPHPDAPALADKFSPSLPKAKFDALVKSVDWFAKIPWIGPGLKAEHISALFAALPSLMEQLRKNVSADVKADRSLAQRLASPYVNAYLNVR